MTELDVARPLKKQELIERLGSRLRSYRSSRPSSTDSLPAVGEVFPLSEVPRGTNIGATLSLTSFGRWHLQVFLDEAPRYYARCAYQQDTSSWRVDWIGESWLAAEVDAGITVLERLEEEGQVAGPTPVRLVSSRRYRFSAFWLVAADEFLVVSAKNRNLSREELISRETLRTTLLETEGEEGWLDQRSESEHDLEALFRTE